MRGFAILFLGILPFFAGLGAEALADAPMSPRVCGLPSAATLVTYQDSVSEIGANVSPTVAVGLDDLYSLPDVQAFVAAVAPDRVCVSAVPVSKNIYQYNELLVVLDLQKNGAAERVLPMLFQTSSIQGHENTGPKPWVGLGRADFEEELARSMQGASLQAAASPAGAAFTPLGLLGQLFAPSPEKPDPGSESYVYVPGVDPSKETYLVSRLRVLDTGNPFTLQYLSDLAMVQVDRASARVTYAEMPDAFDFTVAVENLQAAAEPADDAGSAHLGTLLKLSAP